MPNQADTQQTILNGEYSLGVLTNNNVDIVNMGGLPIRSAYIQWFRLNLQALQDQFGIGDYVSTVTTTLYDRINGFVGLPYNAELDPNYIQSGLVINVDETVINTPIVQVPFTNTSGVGINWQTDIPVGYSQTYAQLLGNYFPNPVVYFASGGDYIDAGTVPTITSSGGLIQTVVFDFGGQPQTGYIRF